MKRRFEFEFEDESPTNTISFEYNESFTEKLNVSAEGGVSVVYANRTGLLFLAKTLIKMALCPYKNGFHIHLEQDVNGDKPEALRVVLDETGETG